MHDPKEQVADVNHFDNKIVVKYEDGTVTLLDGADVRKALDARVANAAPMHPVGKTEPGQ